MIKRSLFVLLGALTLLAGPTLSFTQGSAAESREIHELRAKAESGDAVAQLELALRYNEGVGVPVDDAEAVNWYRRAAEQGNADAQYIVAQMYRRGEGVPNNDAESVKWYRRAADQGDARAQSTLAFMYSDGKGVPKNHTEAHFWWSLAAAKGYGLSKFNRDIVKKRMTREQIDEAQRRLAAWKPKEE